MALLSNRLVFMMACFLFLFFERGLHAMEDLPSPSENTNKINILADKLVFERENNFAEFSGHVEATEKDTVLTADNMKIYFNKDMATRQEASFNNQNIKEIHASGNVRILFDNNEAVSENALYSIENNVLVLTGNNTRVTNGNNFIVGEKITIFRADGSISVESSQQNRVQAEFYSEESTIGKETNIFNKEQTEKSKITP